MKLVSIFVALAGFLSVFVIPVESNIWAPQYPALAVPCSYNESLPDWYNPPWQIRTFYNAFPDELRHRVNQPFPACRISLDPNTKADAFVSKPEQFPCIMNNLCNEIFYKNQVERNEISRKYLRCNYECGLNATLWHGCQKEVLGRAIISETDITTTLCNGPLAVEFEPAQILRYIGCVARDLLGNWTETLSQSSQLNDCQLRALGIVF